MKLLLLVFVIALVVSVDTARPRCCMQSKVSVTYEGPGRVVLGEPVVVRVTITNESSEAVTFTDRARNDFSVAITSPDGSEPNAKFEAYNGISPMRRVTLEAGQTYLRRVLLNYWFDFDQPGTYQIRIGLRDPRTLKELLVLKPAESQIPIEVLPRDEKALQRTCGELVSQITDSTRVPDERWQAALELSFVKDPAAVPYLVRALKEDLPRASFALRGLEKVGNEEAVSALIDAAQYKSPFPWDEALSSLTRLEPRVTNPALKEKIHSLIKK
ncbi:MAG TPA: hypothetical protein VFV34_20350 [Blastocatellia bacterium]|nr:hypothetical protein [Blastocatellia bacterium]